MMTWVLLKRSIVVWTNDNGIANSYLAIMILVIFFNLQMKDASIFEHEVATEDVEATNKLGEMVGDGDDGKEIV